MPCLVMGPGVWTSWDGEPGGRCREDELQLNIREGWTSAEVQTAEYLHLNGHDQKQFEERQKQTVGPVPGCG